MEMKPVDSSMIEAVGYNASSNELVIQFKTGKSYVYAGVPENVWIDMMAAESIGRFFHSEIKSNYETLLHNSEL